MTLTAALLMIALTAGWATAQEKAPGGQEPAAEHAGESPDAAAEGGKAHAAEAGEAAHHDPHDLSHANMTSMTSPLEGLTNPIALKTDMAIFTFFVFLLILFVLTKFAWKPIAHGLEMREKGIADKIEQAQRAADQAIEQLRQYEARLAAATAEAQQIVAKARQDAESARDSIVAEASAAAQKERDRAVADIGAAKNQALREIAGRSVDMAISLARQVIRREVRPADHEQLIQDALQQFPRATRLN
jgi:F-type H+-transporting ATPase subunit b